MINSVIYQIRNEANGKIYIGSAMNFGRRKKCHINDLKNKRHHNQHLQRAWDKYGEKNFIFEIIEEVKSGDKLIEREQCWIDKGCHYNICKTAGTVAGRKHSLQTKEKISKARKGKYIGEKNNTVKLTREQVKEIRDIYSYGTTSINKLSKKYDVSNGCIQALLKNKSWVDKNYIPASKEQLLTKRKIEKLGEKNPSSKLTKNIVLEIRKKYAENNVTITELSKQYNITRSAAGLIIKNKRWVDDEYIPPTKKNIMSRIINRECSEQTKKKIGKANEGENCNTAILTEKQVKQIRNEYEQGNVSQCQLANKYNVARTTIQGVVNGTRWKHVK